MSIASAITSAQNKVAAAYTSCNTMGATMPALSDQDLSHLPATIESIPQGGGGGGCTPYDEQYFTIEAEASGTLNLYNVGTLSISTDGGTTWTDYTAQQISLSVTNGDILLFKKTMASGDMTSTLSTAIAFKAYGNAMSLIYGDNFIGQTTIPNGSTLVSLFYQSGITDASNLILPATTIANNCYNGMFNGCTSLTAAPALPATTTADSCYFGMFRDCTSLTSAPALPATTLASECYASMFRGCTSLISAPALPATTLVSECYGNMFRDCTSLTSAPALPATAVGEYCYASMFRGCTSLISAPVLPATTLVSYCYSAMFRDCSSLKYIVCLATSGLSGNTSNWVSGVSGTGVFIKDSSASWGTGTSGIPSGWTTASE